jgi:hypothetical protein
MFFLAKIWYNYLVRINQGGHMFEVLECGYDFDFVLLVVSQPKDGRVWASPMHHRHEMAMDGDIHSYEEDWVVMPPIEVSDTVMKKEVIGAMPKTGRYVVARMQIPDVRLPGHELSGSNQERLNFANMIYGKISQFGKRNLANAF